MTVPSLIDHLDRIAAALDAAPAVRDGNHWLPDRAGVATLCQRVLDLLLPNCYSASNASTRAMLSGVESHLLDLVLRSEDHAARVAGRDPGPALAAARDHVHGLMGELPEVAGLLATDIDAAFDNDPAATDRAIIARSYPSIEALAVQRFAHRCYRRNLALLPRMMTEWAHSRTGIDIHPGATIDESFFIDHGTGVVIGETSRIGRHCVLYQGVGLVAWNPLARDDHGELQRGQVNKRHPDLADHVTIYAGATILGGDTLIGHHSVIGGGAWLTHSVEPYTVVTMKDPELNIRRRRSS